MKEKNWMAEVAWELNTWEATYQWAPKNLSNQWKKDPVRAEHRKMETEAHRIEHTE